MHSPRMEEGSASEFPDWAHLPSVPVNLISEKIKSVADYFRFRAVCSPWRSASHSKPCHNFCPQLPWLIISFAPTSQRHRFKGGMCLFYDMWESKIRKLHLPETIGKECCATYQGWLLLVDTRGSKLFLLNPLTRARVNLPPFTTPVAHIWDEPGDPPIQVDRHIMYSYSITKMTFSSDLTDPNCIVMVFFSRAKAIFFCRVGDQCWTTVVLPPTPSQERADAAYHNGVFYLLDSEAIFSYDLTEHKVQGVTFFKPELRGVTKFFLVGKTGLNLVSVRFIEVGLATENNNYVRASRQIAELYHIPDDRMEVVRVTDTSDTAIFFGDNYHYLAVCADDWESLDGGCMYFEYLCLPNTGNDGGCIQCEYTPMPIARASYSILLGKLDDDERQLLVSGIGKTAVFGTAPPAMWFQPSLI